MQSSVMELLSHTATQAFSYLSSSLARTIALVLSLPPSLYLSALARTIALVLSLPSSLLSIFFSGSHYCTRSLSSSLSLSFSYVFFTLSKHTFFQYDLINNRTNLHLVLIHPSDGESIHFVSYLFHSNYRTLSVPWRALLRLALCQR